MGNYPKKAGIYKFTCSINGKIYIGKSINLYKRLASHKYCSKKDKGRCYFENALVKYGWDSFIVEILEIFETFDKLKDNKVLLERETYYIDQFKSGSLGIGYNIHKHSTDGTGIPKKPFSEEHRQKLREARAKQVRGPLTDEHKQKISQSRLGQLLSEDHKQKLKGRIISDDQKEKIRQATLGKPRSEETKEKIRQSKLGKLHSEETKEKMRKPKSKKKNMKSPFKTMTEFLRTVEDPDHYTIYVENLPIGKIDLSFIKQLQELRCPHMTTLEIVKFILNEPQIYTK